MDKKASPVETRAAAASAAEETVAATEAPSVHGVDSQRESRRLLSTATSIPRELSERWPVPSGFHLHHKVHKDASLPHFQGGRLGPSEKLDSK